jgi:branched-subunit amino acid aminotransferase/4-amino-4-deoxychorismate lyase
VLLTDIRVPGVTFEERDLHLADLEEADEVFITSTTRDLLPVLSVEGLRLRGPGEVRLALNRALSNYIADYAAANKEKT